MTNNINDRIFYKHPQTGEEINFQFFTSDHHYSHKNIARLAKREAFINDPDTKNMDESLLAQWNNQVNPQDNILHLGDVAMGIIDESLDYIHRGNGTKYLIPGNHDRISSFFSVNRQTKDKPLYESVFTILPEEGILLTAIINGQPINFYASHYPRREEVYDKPKMKMLKTFIPNSIPMIHGHTHSSLIFQDNEPDIYHVGIDAHEMSLVSDSELIQWLKTFL